MSENTMTTETVVERCARLSITPATETRIVSLTVANPMVDDDTFRALATAVRLAKKETIVLPPHRFENLSRGRGWARQGRGDKATWGTREDGGYRVGVGRWVVGGNDGFSRKDETVWDVTHVAVGDMTWTVAN